MLGRRILARFDIIRLSLWWFLVVGCVWQPLGVSASSQICFVDGTEPTRYESQLQICCKGKITSRLRGQECCGDTSNTSSVIYYPDERLCCAGKVVNRFAPPEGADDKECSRNNIQCEEQLCCGGHVIKKETALCCDDEPVILNDTEKHDREYFQCCGKDVVHTSRGFCCGGMIIQDTNYACCGGKSYLKSAQTCDLRYGIELILGVDEGRCGKTTIYNKKEKSCCEDSLYDVPERNPSFPSQRNPHFGCCDSLLIDPTQETCCREHHYGYPSHSIPIDIEIKCCGNGFCNITHQECINGEPKERHEMVRCGNELIDPLERKCCGNLLPYSDASESCCTGFNTVIISKDQECCNGSPMNKSVEVCCEGVIPCQLKDPVHDKCCYNYLTDTGETYSSQNNEWCIDGAVQTLRDGAEPCGPVGQYYPQIQICCDGSVHNKTSGNEECCYSDSYNSKTQRCCLYDGVVYSKNDMTNPCLLPCGEDGTKFDEFEEICCKGVVHPQDSHTVCCGTSAINYIEKDCCGDQFSFPRHSDKVECCGDRELFHTKACMCLNETVVPKDEKLRSRSDVQALCSKSVGRWSDTWVRHACSSSYAIVGKINEVQIYRSVDEAIILMTLKRVRGLDREGFTFWRGQKNLKLEIQVPLDDDLDIKCREKYLTKRSKVMIFFDGEPKHGVVEIKSDANIFLTRYRRKLERHVTSLPQEFCEKKFS